MSAAVVSPELALVDPELRRFALEALPSLEPFAFLSRPSTPRRHPALDDFAFLSDHGDDETFAWQPPVPVAAGIYALYGLAKALVVDCAAVAVLVLLILAANVLR